jgi:hypothetical protein
MAGLRLTFMRAMFAVPSRLSTAFASTPSTFMMSKFCPAVEPNRLAEDRQAVALSELSTLRHN